MTKAPTKPARRRTVPTHVALPPAAYGALGLLALIQAAGGRLESTPVLVRLIRAELEQELPGSWPAALSAALGCPDGATPAERAAAVYEALRALYAQRGESAADQGMQAPEACEHPDNRLRPGGGGWGCELCGAWLSSRPEVTLARPKTIADRVRAAGARVLSEKLNST